MQTIIYRLKRSLRRDYRYAHRFERWTWKEWIILGLAALCLVQSGYTYSAHVLRDEYLDIIGTAARVIEILNGAPIETRNDGRYVWVSRCEIVERGARINAPTL